MADEPPSISDVIDACKPLEPTELAIVTAVIRVLPWLEDEDKQPFMDMIYRGYRRRARRRYGNIEMAGD